MRYRKRARRLEVQSGARGLEILAARRGLWFETEEEVEHALAWGERKAALLRWVRREMGRRLTPRERRCIELYYFSGATYEEAGREEGCTASTACRAVRRAVHKLRAAAREDSSWRAGNGK